MFTSYSINIHCWVDKMVVLKFRKFYPSRPLPLLYPSAGDRWLGAASRSFWAFSPYLNHLRKFRGIKAKDCYRFYTDIRRRKNHSRTYFLDRMQEKLNDKMRKDDELERLRR